MSDQTKEKKELTPQSTTAKPSPSKQKKILSKSTRLKSVEQNISIILTSIEENIDFTGPQGKLAEKFLIILENTVTKKAIPALYAEAERHITYHSILQKTSLTAHNSSLEEISLRTKKVIHDIAVLKKNGKTSLPPSNKKPFPQDSKSTSPGQVRLKRLNQEIAYALINIERNIYFPNQAGQPVEQLAEICLITIETSIQIIGYCIFLQSDKPIEEKLTYIQALLNLGYMDNAILETLKKSFQQQEKSSEQSVQYATILLLEPRIQRWLTKQAKNERSPIQLLLSLLRLPTLHAYGAAIYLLKELVAIGDASTRLALSHILQNKNESARIRAGASAALQASGKPDMKQLLPELQGVLREMTRQAGKEARIAAISTLATIVSQLAGDGNTGIIKAKKGLLDLLRNEKTAVTTSVWGKLMALKKAQLPVDNEILAALKAPAITEDLLRLTLSPITHPPTITLPTNTCSSSSSSSLARGLMPTTLHTQFFSPTDAKGSAKKSEKNDAFIDPQPQGNPATIVPIYGCG